VIYGEANLKPEGDQKQAIDSILSKFPGGGEAGDKLKDLIEKGLRESDAPISFKKDIEPWLGDEAAFFATGIGQNGQLEASAALIATTDEDKARTRSRSPRRARPDAHYKDVDYLTDELRRGGRGVRRLPRARHRGRREGRHRREQGRAEPVRRRRLQEGHRDAASDRLGLFYVNSPEFLHARGRAGARMPDSFKKFFQEPVVATVDADDDGVVVEAQRPAQLARSFAFFGEASDVLGDLPADSWVALGQKDLGKLIELLRRRLRRRGRRPRRDRGAVQGGHGARPPAGRALVDGRLRHLRARHQPASLDGALVVQTSDEASRSASCAALARTREDAGRHRARRSSDAPGGTRASRSWPVPKPIHAFVESGKAGVRLRRRGGEGRGEPGHKLGDSPDFTSVKDSLGDYNVSLYVLVKPILDLVDSTAAAQRRRLAEGQALPRAAERAGGRHLGQRRRPQVGVQARREVARLVTTPG
jgi:hypothetical protein